MDTEQIKYINDRLSYIKSIITNYQLDNLLLESIENEIDEIDNIITEYQKNNK